MDYPCAKLSDFSFSRFDFIVRTDRQTDSQSDRVTEARIIATVGVSIYLETARLMNAILTGRSLFVST